MCFCGHPENFYHYGCSCDCRLCRRKETFRYHLVCFDCRIGYKSNSVTSFKKRSDPDDKISTTLNSIQSDDLPTAYLNVNLNNYMNTFCPDIKCRSCSSPIYVGGFDLRTPKHKDIKEWNKLKELLLNENRYSRKNPRKLFMNYCPKDRMLNR
jgi:hypothetical protein